MGKRLIRECIIIGGEDASGHVLGKTRDRNYRPNLEVVRDLTEDGIEVVYIHDLDTNYLEGMNSEGIGIVNAALLVSEDEAAADKFWSRRKKKGNSNGIPNDLYVNFCFGNPSLTKPSNSWVRRDRCVYFK